MAFEIWHLTLTNRPSVSGRPSETDVLTKWSSHGTLKLISQMFYYENKAKLEGYQYIAGVDEVGRGPLAGPVVACALLLKNKNFKNRIDDSKKLSAKARQAAYEEIVRKAIFGLGWVSKSGIDSINILEATKLAIEKAIRQLLRRISCEKKISQKQLQDKICFLIDGNFFNKKTRYGVRNIVAGDGKSLSIAAASIVAKVSRDHLMNIYGRFFPRYGFSQHKGYGTKAHMAALDKFGPSVIHRQTFYPVKNDYKIRSPRHKVTTSPVPKDVRSLALART